MQTNCKIAETLAHGYSSESTQQELSNEYQQCLDVFHKSLRPCTLDESSLSFRKVKAVILQVFASFLLATFATGSIRVKEPIDAPKHEVDRH